MKMETEKRPVLEHVNECIQALNRAISYGVDECISLDVFAKQELDTMLSASGFIAETSEDLPTVQTSRWRWKDQQTSGDVVVDVIASNALWKPFTLVSAVHKLEAKKPSTKRRSQG